mgnify:CR=1 FL=1
MLKAHSRKAPWNKTLRNISTALALSTLIACASSNPLDPQLEEAIRWYTGETGSVDDERARILLESAASDNDPLSRMWVARVYSTGRMTFPADKALAVQIAASVITQVEVLAEAGNAEAMFLMGTAYAEGLAKSQDPITALTWYRRAADQQHVLAQHNIGNAYSSGTGVEASNEMAAYWWQLAAQQGDAVVQYRLAQLFEQGLGVPQDMSVALRWYADSARRGNDNAKQALTRLGVPLQSAQ